MDIFSNTFNVPTLGWSGRARSASLTLEPGHPIPAGVTMLTVRSMNRHVLVWDLQDIIIIHPTCTDVLGGRGRHSLSHPGNIWFTRLAGQFMTSYHTGSSSEKTNIILQGIMAPMSEQGRRFLKLIVHDRQHNIWKWVLDPDARAKIGNKLRDMFAAAAQEDAQHYSHDASSLPSLPSAVVINHPTMSSATTSPLASLPPDPAAPAYLALLSGDDLLDDDVFLAEDDDDLEKALKDTF